jgi:hypothetical protein
MDLSDIELIQDMTRIIESPEAVVFEVVEVHWLKPRSPCIVWHPVVVLPPGSSPIRIEAARKSLLHRKRFFALCAECGLRNIKGHMASAFLCMGCAERNHDIVY